MGGSLAAQALAWFRTGPASRHCAVIAPTPAVGAKHCQRRRAAILTDPGFHGGDYYAHGVVPKNGLRGAHGGSYYLSTTTWPRFGRDPRPGSWSSPASI